MAAPTTMQDRWRKQTEVKLCDMVFEQGQYRDEVEKMQRDANVPTQVLSRAQGRLADADHRLERYAMRSRVIHQSRQHGPEATHKYRFKSPRKYNR